MRFSLIGPVYPYRGGIAHYTATLDRALEKADHETQLLSYLRQFPSWLYPGASDKDPSQQPITSNAEYILDPFYPWTWIDCVNKIAVFHPDLIVIQWWTTFWALPDAVIAKLLHRKGFRVSYLIHNVMPHEAKTWDPWLAKLALSTADSFIVQTQNEKPRLEALIPNANTHICHLPIFSMFSEEKISRHEARKLLEIPPNSAVVLFFGIVRPYKGLDMLIDAIAQLKGLEKPPYLVIAGEFWESKDHYLEQIESKGLVQQVLIVDRYIPNEEVRIYFSAADVVVAPYTAGTQSAVAKVAMAFGMPLVVTKQVAEGIDESYKNQLHIAPAGDSIALAEAIHSALSHDTRDAVHLAPNEDDWLGIVQTLENLAQ